MHGRVLAQGLDGKTKGEVMNDTTKRADVERLAPCVDHHNCCLSMRAEVGGDYVRHSDYAALEAKLAERDAEVELLRSDAERISSCPWRVQKYVTALCQPPKNMREALDRAEAAEHAKAEACGLLADAVDWLKPTQDSPPSLDTLHRRIADFLAAFLAANGEK